MHPRRLTLLARTTTGPRRPREHYLGMGALVQHQQADAPPQAPATGGSRSTVLRLPADRPGIDGIVLSLTTKGLTTVVIAAHIADVYGASYRRTRFRGHQQGHR